MGEKRGVRGEKRQRKRGGDEREGQRAKMRQAERVELGGFDRVPVPVSSPDLFPKTLTLRTYTLLHD